MTRVIEKTFGPGVRGLNLAQNDLTRDGIYTKTFKNVILNANEEIDKRNGYHIACQQANGAGLTTIIETAAGESTEELYCWMEDLGDSNLLKLHKLEKGIITISHGAAATFDLQLYPVGGIWQLNAVRNGSSIISGGAQSYGDGLSPTSGNGLAQLETDLETISGVTVGLGSLYATLSSSVTDKLHVSSLGAINTTLSTGSGFTYLTYYVWVPVVTGVSSSAYTQLPYNYMESYTNPNAAVLNEVAYWARDQQGATSELFSASQPVMKYDGLLCYQAGLPAVLINTIANGTAGTEFSTTEEYDYKVHLKRLDGKGNTVFSTLASKSFTPTVNSDDLQVAITGYTTFAGYGAAAIASHLMRKAKVNGAQTSATITVDSGHTLEADDEVYVSSSNVLVRRTVASTTATTITLDSSVTVADNEYISNIAFELYRTIGNGTTYYLTAEKPHDFELGQTYVDATTDADLVDKDELIEPLIERLPPPPCRFVCEHQELLIFAGIPGREQEVGFADLTSPEYVPSSNYIDVATTGLGPTVGIGSDGERLYIFKEKSHVVVHGNLRAVDPGQPPDIYVEERRGVGCTSHDTIRQGVDPQGKTTLYFLSNRGPQRIIGGALDVMFNAKTAPFFKDLVDTQEEIVTFTNQDNFTNKVRLRAATAVYDELRQLYVLAIPIQTGDVSSNYLGSTDVKMFVYEEFQDETIGDRWFEWTSETPLLGFARGMAIYENRIHGLTDARISSAAKYCMMREMIRDDKYKFADNVEEIVSDWHIGWINFDNPSVGKLVNMLRIWKAQRTESFEESITVNFYRDLVDASDSANAYSSATVTLGATEREETLEPIMEEWFNLLVQLTNNTLHEGMRVTGVEMAINAEFEGGDIEEI